MSARHFREEVICAAWRKLSEKIPELLRVPAVERGFCNALSRRLERTSRQVFAARGISWPGSQLELGDILKEFRGLARIWDAQIKGWSRFVVLFAQHATEFQGYRERQRGAIVELESDLSDLHDGRSVTRVRFRKDGVWYYKPRNGCREAAWSHFLSAINAAGFRPHFFLPEVHPRMLHCWMRHVPHRKNRSGAGQRRLHFRVGALLYVAHCFRAVDLHAENFVLHGEHPVLIDCETLFHPETKLPEFAFVGEDDLGRTGMIGDSKNHVLINSEILDFDDVAARERRDELARGFRSMHGFLHHHAKKRPLQRAIERMRTERTRLILRPTILYSRLLEGALSPDCLRRPLGPARALHARLNDGLLPLSVVRREVRQLLRGDIPFFNGSASARRASSEHEFDHMFVKRLSGLRRCYA